jgi:hypothetical protein
MVLLDWTRMGKVYCLAGVVFQGGRYRVVRPLHLRGRTAAERNTGWSPFLYDRHRRWEVLQLVDAVAADGQAPHLEDLWVRELRATGRVASPDQRRAILQSTISPDGEPPFGAPLVLTRAGAYLLPGNGGRSLATVVVRADTLCFSASQRQGSPEPDFRVTLSAPGLEDRTLPVKDHWLLRTAEQQASDLGGSAEALGRLVRAMGERVAVRLGLTRAFGATSSRGEGMCWLMADGFFSLTDPQP